MKSQSFSGISGAVLKWTAVITMFIDHFALAIYYTALHNDFTIRPNYSQYYEIMRNIGRTAFPIFIFLLIEGYKHTKDATKYMIRLALFAVISEIPFDLAFHNKLWYPEKQNIFFTLLIGIIVIYSIEQFKKLLHSRISSSYVMPAIEVMVYAGLISIGCAAGYYLKVDYSYVGILAICIVWLLRDKPIIGMILCCLSLLLVSKRELYSFIAILPIIIYNGKRGKQNKYFFYIFYPVHLIVFWGIEKIFIL